MHDVAIVGLGPTGATLANLLAQQGVRVLVLDREADIYPLPRAVHFDGECMRVFQSIGIADALVVTEAAVEKHGATASVVFVPAPFAKDAVLEALDAGIKLVVVITEHVPLHDAMEIDANGYVKTNIAQKELNDLAAKSFTEPSLALLDRAGLSIRDVDWVVPHSGTAGIQATLITPAGAGRDSRLTSADLTASST